MGQYNLKLMKQDRFDSILKQMSSSMKMMLDYLKRYLDEGKASAFVGAGFSRNATMPETAEMKDWNMLGTDFYQRKPSSSDAMFLSPIHLASEVEASFGRNELDNLIIQSLPDDIIVPSKLHKNLLDLNWHDVFTTNYDTLLERAYLDTERPYTIVTNKETLLYSTSPRIVKLHGSFPNIRPFIITEEDYRTYPDRFPEFVNTVRQALVENLFCLIGFSGDDPNFKSWYGWLRDVMGQQIAPVYMITYNPDLHDAKKKLFAKQKIDILNLADLPNISGFQEGYEFLFQYLAHDGNSMQWDGHIAQSLYSVNNKEKLIAVTEEMARVRRAYPDWFTLPHKYYWNFVDVVNDIVGFDFAMINNIGIVDKIHFLYELCWRQNISNTPIGVDWYVDAIADAPMVSEEYCGETSQMVIELKLALLRHFRKHGQYEGFNSLVSELEQKQSLFKEPQVRLFNYERCLCAASLLDYEKLETLINQWEVASTDYIGALWKACMLVELNRNNDAVNLLNAALRQLNITILANRGRTEYLKSCQSVLTRVLRLYSRGRIVASHHNDQNDVYEIMHYFQSKLLGDHNEKAKTRSHKFNVGQTQVSWSFGRTGFFEDYVFSYRYFSLRENCGLPFGMLSVTLDKDDQIVFLKHLLSYNFQYAFAIIIRSCNKEYIQSCITRKALVSVSRAEADAIFEKYLAVAKTLRTNMGDAIKMRILNVLLPLLSRLSTKANGENTWELLDIQYNVYRQFCRFLARNDIETIYNNLPNDKRVISQRTSLELPFILDDFNNNDFPQIDDNKDRLVVTETMVSRIVDGLSHHHPDIQRNAYLRLKIVAFGVFSNEARKILQKAIIVWQSQTKNASQLRDSLVSLPFAETPKDEVIIQDLLNKDLESLSKLDTLNIHSSEVFDTFCELLSRFHLFIERMTANNHQLVIEKFISLVDENENLLSKDNPDELFGGFRHNMTSLIHHMEGYLFKLDLLVVSEPLLRQLTDTVEKLSRWGYRHLAMQILLCRYDRRLKESAIKASIDESLAVYDFYKDAYQALVFLSKRNTKFQQIIQGIIRFCMYSKSEIVFDWLDCLTFFVKENTMTKETKVQMLKMLSYIYDNLNDDVDIDVINDIFVNSARLAGAAAKQWGDSAETDKWKGLLLSGKNIFNEVRYAFYYENE